MLLQKLLASQENFRATKPAFTSEFPEVRVQGDLLGSNCNIWGSVGDNVGGFPKLCGPLFKLEGSECTKQGGVFPHYI